MFQKQRCKAKRGNKYFSTKNNYNNCKTTSEQKQTPKWFFTNLFISLSLMVRVLLNRFVMHPQENIN